MTAALPPQRSEASSRPERHRRALATLEQFGQTQVLGAWDHLAPDEQDHLLGQIERVDWALAHTLIQHLVVERRAPFTLPEAPWEPAVAASPDETARAAGLEVLRDSERSALAVLVLAGGSGSRLRFPHAKGLVAATPLSGVPLYQIMVEKSKAAARALGHRHMFPLLVMVSDETAAETRAYFQANDWFGEADRILLAEQEVMPLIDRRSGREGKVVMLSSHELAMGGAGHGDALDVVLARDPAVRRWLAALGVRYVQLVNIDNPLAPIADPELLGIHVGTASPAIAGRAHISVMLIPKSASPRLGSIIQYRDRGQLLHQSIDYGIIPDVDARCELGHANLQVVTLESLPASNPIPFTAAQKEISIGREQVQVWKFERSCVNKDRYGALLFREADEVFAPIKTRHAEATTETPAAAARLQSDHWKRVLREACSGAGVSCTIDPTSLLELPWDADYIERNTLADALRTIGFPTVLAPGTGYEVHSEFTRYRVIPELSREGPALRMTPDASYDNDPDEQRRRALIGAFTAAFGQEPDVIVRAPGRNTAIGDHLDYPPLPRDGSASSQTIAWATRQNVLVAAARRTDRTVALHTLNDDQTFTLHLDDLDRYAEQAGQRTLSDIDGQPLYSWVLSTLALLYSASVGVSGVRRGLPLYGASFAIEANLPRGAGQSSSAAFLVGMTLACNEMFGWEIPRTDAFTLADIARSGEHEEYSPFIERGRAGYLDQIAILSAKEGLAVVIDHGDYAHQEWVDLDVVERQGYRNVVVLSGLSRALGETEYVTRVEELRRLPAVLNSILAGRHEDCQPKSHIYQFSLADWHAAKSDLEAADAALAWRARYVFEERERTGRFRVALAGARIDELLDVVNASGMAMSMNGPYQISGYNHVPSSNHRIAALDLLRETVLRYAGPRGAARLIGGGGAGPIYALVPATVYDSPAFARNIEEEWRRLTGLTARVATDAPARGAEIIWRR